MEFSLGKVKFLYITIQTFLFIYFYTFVTLKFIKSENRLVYIYKKKQLINAFLSLFCK